jgi:cell division protein FtsQ
VINLHAVKNTKVIKYSKLKKSKKTNFKKLSLIFLSVFLLLTGIMFFTKVNILSVSGNKHYSKEEIYKIVGINERSNIFNVYFNSKNNYKSYPYIDSIEIEHNSYKNISIIVDEKNIIGYIWYMGKYLCLSEEAYIIDYTDKIDAGIPLIEGIKIDKFVIKEKIPIKEEVIDSLILIGSTLKEYKIQLDKIDFNYNLPNKLYLYYKGIEINVGNTNHIYEKMQIINEILKTLPLDSKGVLDVTDINKKIVFKKKSK